ncbi:MAG: PQQ-binding-like beta-propeller repeat protein [Ardenticatenales bacterium]|nr:PQQ-binding-like beta-propeller repeat protein [Ardenticatenales bacterium]
MSRPASPTPGVPAGTLAPGTMLAARYQIEKVIGSGGMGAVYSARDRRFRAVVRRCAVKEMFDTIADPAARQRARENFEREANLLASLNHAAIPKVFDYFTEGDRHYLVHEFIEGQDLARVLHQRARPMPPEKVIDWAIQLTFVLDALHSSEPPIIFRDLKPSNVMLRTDGQIVLVDFGIAKHFQPVQKGTMIGTEGYAPPEQYEGVANPRVDIYALGATMHQLLTNTDPQEYRPFSYNQRPLRQYNPSVSSEVDGIVMRALAYEPAERWEDMKEIRSALQRVHQAGSSPAVKRPAPPTESAEQPTGFRPTDPAALRGTGLFARLRPEQADEGGTRPVSPPGEGTRPVSPPPAVPDMGTRPVGQEPPYQAPPVMPPMGSTIDLQQEIKGEAAFVPIWTFATEDEVRSTPEIKDDLLYIGSYDTNIYCLDVATGDFRWKYATNGGIPGTPAVEGELVIVGSEDHKLYALNRRTGRLEWDAQTGGRIRSSPRVLADHVFIGSDDGHVYAFNATRGKLLWKYDAGSPVRSSAAIGDETIFMGAEDGSMTSIDMSTGESRWRIYTGGPVISSPIMAEQRVIFGSMDRQVYGVDGRSGWVVWQAKLTDRVYSSPCLVDDRIYIATVDGNIYAITADWGKEIWKLSLKTQITSSPFVDEDKKLYIGGVDGGLYCINTVKGKELWRFSTGGPIPGSPRSRSGVVFFGSLDHRVYAIPSRATPRSF